MSERFDLCLHIDRADPALLKFLLGNAANYFNGLPGATFQLDVVANGPAVTLFTAENEALRAQAKPLVEAGMRIKLCANAIAATGVDKSALWPECRIVPAGLVEIVKLKNAGFAYIKP